MKKTHNYTNDQSLQYFFKVIDFVLIILSMYFSLYVENELITKAYLNLVLVFIITFYTLASLFGLYQFEVYSLFKHSFKRVLLTSFVTFLVLISLGYIFNIIDSYPRAIINNFFILMLTLILSWRLLLCKGHNFYFNKQQVKRNFAVIGANTIGNHIAETIINDLSHGYLFKGFYDDRNEDDERIIDSLSKYEHLGDFDQAILDAKSGGLD